MKTRFLLALMCLGAAVLICWPTGPGATRFAGRYIGSPNSGYKFTNNASSYIVVTYGQHEYYVSESRETALIAAGIGLTSLQHVGSPYVGYIGHEADTFREQGGAGRAVYLNSYSIWIASRTSDEEDILLLGSRVSFFGPAIALYMLLVGFTIALWPLCRRMASKLAALLSKPVPRFGFRARK